jgi:hypothetical protein
MKYSSERTWHSGGTHCLHLQGWRVNQRKQAAGWRCSVYSMGFWNVMLCNLERVQTELTLLPASAGFLLGLFFDSEDGGLMFPQNVELCLKLHNVNNHNDHTPSWRALWQPQRLNMLHVFYLIFLFVSGHESSSAHHENKFHRQVSSSKTYEQKHIMQCPCSVNCHEHYAKDCIQSNIISIASYNEINICTSSLRGSCGLRI